MADIHSGSMLLQCTVTGTLTAISRKSRIFMAAVTKCSYEATLRGRDAALLVGGHDEDFRAFRQL